jgi:ketosteroid isomerase-like protein
MTKQDAEAFARSWLAAWNDRDLDAILQHYEKGIVFHSPRIADVMGGIATSVIGRGALQTY